MDSVQTVAPYSLIDPVLGSSDNYYKEVSIFADLVIKNAERSIGEIVRDYHLYCEREFPRNTRYLKEGLLEFLTIGVLWDEYMELALGADPSIEKRLFQLTEIRQRNVAVKGDVDPLRGFLATLLITSCQMDNRPDQFSRNNTLFYYHRLIAWLSATGEFTQEVSVAIRWQNFLSDLTEERRYKYLNKGLELARWFKMSSLEFLGQYTSGVEKYLESQGKEHYWAEDVIFCNRKRVEYHLNMVAAEILSQAYQSEYKNTDQKMIFLPACMRLKKNDCPAKKLPFGFRCCHCSSECQVSQITYMGKENNIGVFIIPHESMLFSKEVRNDILGERVGIIGVACPLNLIAGGWKAKLMGFPAQCVLLDYCGCENHWDSEGIKTNINLSKLEEIIFGLKAKRGETVKRR